MLKMIFLYFTDVGKQQNVTLSDDVCLRSEFIWTALIALNAVLMKPNNKSI
jgi:hypothetical protein